MPVIGSNGVVGHHDESLISGPGIVVGRKGSAGSATWIDSDFWPIDTTYYVDKIVEGVDVRWLYYAISMLRLDKLSEGPVPGLNRHSAAELALRLPPHTEQRKIAAVLSSVDDAIEKAQAVTDQVQVVKRGLARQLLAGLGGVVRQVRRLHDCAWVNPEQLASTADPDSIVEYLDITAIERPGFVGRTRTLQFADAPSRARRLAREGDILVSTVRPYLRNFARIREAPDNLVVSTGYAVIRPKDDADGEFLYQHILSPGFVEFLRPRMSGSNYPAVKASDVAAYPVRLPPLPEQRKTGEVLSSLDHTVAKMRMAVDRACDVKEALMAVLLTGELRVAEDVEVV